MLLYFHLIILAAGLINAIEEDPLITLTSGLIRGKSHGHYYSFEGIPYAEPPIGENRFESPIPYQWKSQDIFDATKLHESCIRYDPMEKRLNSTSIAEVVGSEDCLYLNIYTPGLNSSAPYPVMFYIHGGAFMFGSGDDLREHILMEHQSMILVTFNYRLGPLGFLSTGDEEISGNMGLKDQQLALKWISENIHSFNGNANQILLAGFSAGSGSVEYHLLQPEIENYVNAAISFSGSALCPWALIKEPLKDALKMADIFACRKSTNEVITTKQIKECLKKVPDTDMVSAVREYQSFLYNPIRVFGPVIEPKSVKDAFITDYPSNLIKNGFLAKNIPWLATVTAQEASLWISTLIITGEEGKKIREEFNKDPKKLLSLMFFVDENKSEDETRKEIEILWEKYDLPEKFTAADAQKFIKVGTDITLKDQIFDSLKLHAQFGQAPTYGYFYDNPALYGWGNFISGNTDFDFGAAHGDDVFLMLDYPQRDMKKFPFRDDEKEYSRNFVKMLESFATLRDPKFGNFSIEKITPNNHKIAKITRTSIKMEDF